MMMIVDCGDYVYDDVDDNDDDDDDVDDDNMICAVRHFWFKLHNMMKMINDQFEILWSYFILLF